MPTMVIVIDIDELRGLFSTPGPFAVRARSETSGREYATTWEDRFDLCNAHCAIGYTAVQNRLKQARKESEQYIVANIMN